MAIVSISSLSDTHDAEISHAAAGRLGYGFCDLDSAIEEAAERYDAPADKLSRACREVPSLFGMPRATRRRLLAYVQATIAARLAGDDVVLLGPVARPLAVGISHMLKVRLVASLDDRIARRAESEQCPTREAERRVRHDDKQRIALARQVYSTDDDDEGAFDLVVDTSERDVEAAATMIVDAARQPRYRSMTYSVACMRDIELACRLRAELVTLDPDVEVEASGRSVRVRLSDAGRSPQRRKQEALDRASRLDGVDHVDVLTVKSPF